MNASPARPLAALVLALAAGCSLRGNGPDGSGTIECTQVRIAPQVPGRIAELGPREGDRVATNQAVARLDPADYTLRRDEARAVVAQARAQLDLLRAGSRTEDVQRAREQVREARAAAAAAAADRGRIEKVFADGSATRKQFDDANAGAERAAASLAAAEQALARLEKGSRDEEVRIAEAAVSVAEARLAQLEKGLADCTIVSPVAGVVTSRQHEPGEVVAAGASLLTVSRLDEVWLSIYVPEPKLASVRLGAKARVRADGDPRDRIGRVTFVSPEAEFTPRNVQTPDERAKLVYRVKITLDNADGALKPGMPADGWLGTMP